ncbi:mitochondrial peptide methionine sulfoxide reductase-like [Pipra filicauda]|uniref:Mitochondrial peptide methionine sulfoxide reductase n=1 Tax=Pipra filicauda TaxID=649802 RepID=A0A6J2FYL6_9PASS|nr:mitochondrial peptide methionine sulfoxide reductase-like [Pipra filicauda]
MPPRRLLLLLLARALRGSAFAMGDSASRLPQEGEALPGRTQRMAVADKHHVNGNRMVEPFPEGTQMALFGMGCFWGAERKFWRQKGVYSTQVGYAGGHTPNPTYKEVCSGRTGHTEAVRVVYQPENISFEQLLKVFWENHDPTQGMRQGNDVGTQYRSAIYTFSQEQMEAALRSKEEYQKVTLGRVWNSFPYEQRSKMSPVSTTSLLVLCVFCVAVGAPRADNELASQLL